MSFLRIAAPLASLVFFSASAVAQISAPSCNSASWQWTSNFLDQSPCDVAAYMMSTCDGGEFAFGPLPSGYSYTGPDSPQDADFCQCSTVLYSLVSACDACQGDDWITWSEWIANCTNPLPPGSFPYPVPSGTRLPHWAVLDVTHENKWNSSKSHADTSSPEIAPGSILSPTGASNSISPTSSSSPSSTTSPAPPPTVGSSSNTAAIVGGAVGCVVAILIAIVAIFYLRQRSRERSSVSAGVGASQPGRPLSDGGLAPSSLPVSPVAMKFYDPNDSTVLSGHQGGPHSHDTSSYIGSYSSESTLAHTQPSRPQDRVYHGHTAV